jgi:hypothetical protein
MDGRTPDDLRVGFAQRDITPVLGTALAGRPTLLPRLARSIRDSLFARALHIATGPAKLTVLGVDLLLVTQSVHRAVAEAARLREEELFLCATHTHSAPGGYWRGGLIERFMGEFRPATFAWLVRELGAAARQAAEDTAAASLSASAVELTGASSNRRGPDHGAVDPALTLTLFRFDSDRPVCLVAFGAHPVAGMERAPNWVTGDYPGEVCRRLERRGFRPLFLLGAAAGTSPGYPGGSLDEHIERMGDALDAGIERARQRLTPVVRSRLGARAIPLLAAAAPCRILPDGVRGKAVLDLISLPLRAIVEAMAREGFQENAELSLHFVRLGDVALVGVPAEVGPGVSRRLRDLLYFAGIQVPIVVSMCNGYAGYAHLRADYAEARSLRRLMLYENAMSVAGWDLGERILATTREALALA